MTSRSYKQEHVPPELRQRTLPSRIVALAGLVRRPIELDDDYIVVVLMTKPGNVVADRDVSFE